MISRLVQTGLALAIVGLSPLAFSQSLLQTSGGAAIGAGAIATASAFRMSKISRADANELRGLFNKAFGSAQGSGHGVPVWRYTETLEEAKVRHLMGLSEEQAFLQRTQPPGYFQRYQALHDERIKIAQGQFKPTPQEVHISLRDIDRVPASVRAQIEARLKQLKAAHPDMKMSLISPKDADAVFSKALNRGNARSLVRTGGGLVMIVGLSLIVADSVLSSGSSQNLASKGSGNASQLPTAAKGRN